MTSEPLLRSPADPVAPRAHTSAAATTAQSTRHDTVIRATTVALTAVGALLAVGVTVVHVKDQGGITAFADPDWLGWAYRLVEVGALLTALVLATGRIRPLAWLAAFAVGAGPFVGYLLTRTVGLPQDSGDKSNWADPVGTASLVLEALLMVVAVLSLVRSTRRARAAA